MTTLDLDVYGVGISVSGDARALEELSVHLPGFAAARHGVPARVVIELCRGEPERGFPSRSVADQVLDRGIVYNVGRVVLVDHHGRASSRYDFATETGVVRAPDVADLVELGYLMIHSRLGVLLEERGLVRVHACGFVIEDRAALVLAPSGGGKSRLALALLDDPRVRLLGDDTVLLDTRGRCHPFPHPIGVSSPELGRHLGPVRPFRRRMHEDKWVIEPDALLPRHATGSFPVALIALVRRASAAPSRCLPASRRAVAGALFRDCVVGLGLPQVLELALRHGARDLWRMAPSAARRSRAALMALRSARGVVLEVHEPAGAARSLADELRVRG